MFYAAKVDCMKHVVISLFILLAVCFLSLYQIQESFTSPGTLVQLSSTHVPDYNDLVGMQQYVRQVRRDLIDMTGSA